MIWLLLATALSSAQARGTGEQQMIGVVAGSYTPLYPVDPNKPVTEVEDFGLDVHPVTKGEFLAFVLRDPKWQRGQVPALFADEGYLGDWAAPIRPDGRLSQPVVDISWYAARAYCDSRGARLPTEDEWEYVARASVERADATDEDAYLASILAWYGQPTPDDLPNVGRNPANFHGVHDMHGLVWEWVEDFSNTLFGTDVRDSGNEDRLRFCGSGALSATDVRDYASFMRAAFRSSLEARYTTGNLGFRCAMDGQIP